MWGKTNIQGIKDNNLTAGNIKNGVSIGGVTGIFPNDGTATADKVLSGYTFYSNSASQLTGNLSSVAPLANIYISTSDQFFAAVYYTDGTSTLGTQYCFTVGNFIYTPIFYTNNGIDPATINVGMMKMSIDSSVAISITAGGSYSGAAGTNFITSQYLDNGIVYFNASGSNKYHSYNTSTGAWSLKNTGSHTTGTLINSALQLNGYQYDQYNSNSNYGTYTFVTVKTKVTKL